LFEVPAQETVSKAAVDVEVEDLVSSRLTAANNEEIHPIWTENAGPSTTQHWAGKLIAVIVSGYDGDGAAALCGLKEVGALPSHRS
jgi:hypothetical protein